MSIDSRADAAAVRDTTNKKTVILSNNRRIRPFFVSSLFIAPELLRKFVFLPSVRKRSKKSGVQKSCPMPLVPNLLLATGLSRLLV